MKGSAETVTQEEAIIQAGFAGRGLISSTRSRADTKRKTRDHDPHGCWGESEGATRLASIVRSIDRDGITSCQSRGRIFLRPGHSSCGNSWWAAILWCPTDAYRSQQRRVRAPRTTCLPVIKVTIERNNSDESRNFPLPGAHSLPPQSTLLNGSSVTRNLRFRTYNIIDRRRNNCEFRTVRMATFCFNSPRQVSRSGHVCEKERKEERFLFFFRVSSSAAEGTQW